MIDAMKFAFGLACVVFRLYLASFDGNPSLALWNGYQTISQRTFGQLSLGAFKPNYCELYGYDSPSCFYSQPITAEPIAFDSHFSEFDVEPELATSRLDDVIEPAELSTVEPANDEPTHANEQRPTFHAVLAQPHSPLRHFQLAWLTARNLALALIAVVLIVAAVFKLDCILETLASEPACFKGGDVEVVVADETKVDATKWQIAYSEFVYL